MRMPNQNCGGETPLPFEDLLDFYKYFPKPVRTAFRDNCVKTPQEETTCCNRDSNIPGRGLGHAVQRDTHYHDHELEENQGQQQGKARISPEEDQEEWKNRYVRLRADFENYRRLAEEEKRQLTGIGEDYVLVSILPFVDQMERAISAARAAGDRSGILQGLEMVHKELLTVLEKYRVDRIKTVGKSFDPNLHEAVAVIKHSRFPEGIVAEELRPGFTREGRLLRAASVRVAQ